MKKQLNVDAITNELRGNSAFFPRLKMEAAAEPVAEQTPPGPKPASTSRPVPPVRVVPPVPLVRVVRGTPGPKRVMKQRHPFDIYQDQYEALQQLALEERKRGGVGSMSAMVREALDQLITAKKHGKK